MKFVTKIAKLLFFFLIWTYYIRKECRKVLHDNVTVTCQMNGVI